MRIAALECLEDIVKGTLGKRALSGDVAQETKTKLSFASTSDKSSVVRGLASSVTEHLNEVEMGEGTN